MTLKFCDICGSDINVKYTVEISEHTPLELCDKCWKCAWIHFETLKKRYKIQASKETGIPSSTIYDCTRGARKKAWGYIWKYAN